MKKIILVVLLMVSLTCAKAQEISPYLIGNNAWLPQWLGGKWNELKDDMGDAGFQLIRIGGNGAQSPDSYTNARIADLVVDIRKQGAEAIVQVPYTHSAQEVTTMITYINGIRGLGVKYWAIGNEPNLRPKVSVTVIAQYTRRIATALKAYDPTIKTLGPTTAWYDASYLNPLFVNKGGDDISGVDANGNYYIDILTWNKYSITYGMEYNATITSAVNLVNSQNILRPEGKKMQWAILELNGHHDNDQATEAQKCWSFNTGQTFAELFDIGMRRGAFTIAGWSIYEGGGNRSTGDLGLFDGLGNKTNLTFRGRSTYYHSLMLGRHMKASYIPSVHNGPPPSGANNGVTVSCMGDLNGFSVMIINRSKTEGYDYSIGFNNVYGSNAALLIRVAADLDKELSGHIAVKTTQMLVFDAQGNMVRKYDYNENHSKNFCGPEIIDYSTAGAADGFLNFISPSNGGKFKNDPQQKVEIEAYHPSGIASVELYLDDELVGVLHEAPYKWDYTNEKLANLVVGFHDMRAVSNIVGGGTITNIINFSFEDLILLPGKIEAEFFDNMYGIETGEVQDEGGGLYVGWVDTGDWLDYIVDVQETGLYKILFRVAGWTDNGRIVLRNTDGINLTGANVPNAGSNQYQSWGNVTGENAFIMDKGIQVIRVFAEGSPFNVNYFTLTKDVNNSINQNRLNVMRVYPQPCGDVLYFEGFSEFHSLNLYNQVGQVVRELTNLNGDKVILDMSVMKSGFYLAKFFNNYEKSVVKIMKK